MASNDLKTWVSDKLMVLLGYSQAAVVNYLIAMGEFLMFWFWIMELMKHFLLVLLIYNGVIIILQLKNQNHQLNLWESWWITGFLLLVILVRLPKKFSPEFPVKLLL